MMLCGTHEDEHSSDAGAAVVGARWWQRWWKLFSQVLSCCSVELIHWLETDSDASTSHWKVCTELDGYCSLLAWIQWVNIIHDLARDRYLIWLSRSWYPYLSGKMCSSWIIVFHTGLENCWSVVSSSPVTYRTFCHRHSKKLEIVTQHWATIGESSWVTHCWWECDCVCHRHRAEWLTANRLSVLTKRSLSLPPMNIPTR